MTEFEEVKKTKIVIVDDHETECKGIEEYLKTMLPGDIEVIGIAHSDIEARDVVTSEVDLVIMDADLENTTNNSVDGFTLAKEFIKDFPDIAILFYTYHDNLVLLERAKAIKARGYVVKTGKSMPLIRAVTIVCAGGTIWPSGHGRKRDCDCILDLRDKPKKVAEYIAMGFYKDEVVAKIMYTVKATSRVHRSTIRSFCGFADDFELFECVKEAYPIRDRDVNPDRDIKTICDNVLNYWQEIEDIFGIDKYEVIKADETQLLFGWINEEENVDLNKLVEDKKILNQCLQLQYQKTKPDITATFKKIDIAQQYLKQILDEESENLKKFADILRKLGELYGHNLLKNNDGAMESYRQALVMYKKIIPEKERAVESYDKTQPLRVKLGDLCNSMNKHLEAKNYYEQALQIYKAEYEDDYKGTQDMREKLGDTHYSLKEYEAAIGYYNKAHEIYETYPPRDSDLLKNLLKKLENCQKRKEK